MSLVDHAEVELRTAGLFAKDSDYDGMLGEAVMTLVRTFADQGHSGFSAAMTIDLFRRVASYEPLGPITGEASEWMDVSEVSGRLLQQNVRCSRVFREGDVAYDIDAVVYRERNGASFTSWDSARRIRFPYTPKTRTVPAWLRRPERLLARLLGRLRPVTPASTAFQENEEER